MLDWLFREGGIVLSWWLLVTLAGVAVLPLVARLLGGLPDKGYTLARSAGLLLVGFTYWLLASFGFLRNTPGNIVLAWVIVLALSVVTYMRFGSPVSLRAWWSENRPVVIVGELLFLVMLFGWAVYRSHQNGLFGTEKPMELMFMSAVQRSESFPPNDAWLSGYAISYYYFGYVMSAMLSMLSGIGSTVGFNMTAALWFALTGLAVFGVVYNLVRSRAGRGVDEPQPDRQRLHALLAGLLGTFLLVFMGNFQLPLVEIPYQTNTASPEYLEFWGVPERKTTLDLPGQPGRGLDLTLWNGWWWFRASRTVGDLDLAGNHVEVIDEFPMFSFILSDNHPHVLALPFVLLALGMALNVVLLGRDPNVPEVLFYGLTIGGLIFLNTWDGPVYLMAIVGADALRRLIRNSTGYLKDTDWLGLLFLGLSLLGLAIILYLPFLVSFRSQAGGVLPNVIYPTRPQQFFLMFGPFIFLLLPFLLVETWRARHRTNWFLVIGAICGVLLLLLAVVAGAIYIAWPAMQESVLRYINEAGGWESVFPIVLARRLNGLVLVLALLFAVMLILNRLFPLLFSFGRRKHDADEGMPMVSYPAATGFALVLVGMGVTLALVPEFAYLRDNFGTRINTIFKLYYQTWVLFSVAGAYAVYTILAESHLPKPSPGVQFAYSLILLGVLSLGLFYPVMATYSRMFVEAGQGEITLNGGRTFAGLQDYDAIMCLNDLVQGDDVIVSEAIGPAYQWQFGRVAALSGLPTVMGWEGHQRQWRGGTYNEVAGTRTTDIPNLYRDPRWEIAQQIINAYGIDYIFYGDSERNTYGSAGEEKFVDRFEVVCERGSSRFYRVNPNAVAAG